MQLKFRSILKKIVETKQLMGEVMKEASFSLAEAKFASSGDLNQAVLQNVNKAQIKVKTKNDNVAGVNLPVFESYQVSNSHPPYYCLICSFRMALTPMSWLGLQKEDNS